MAKADALAKAEAGSSAWAELYAQHATALLHYLAKLTGDREEATELLQETFLRGMRSGRSATELSAPRAFLFRIATNAARDRYRRRMLLRFIPFTGREVDPTDRLDPHTMLVHQVLASLPQSQAAALLLHYDAGLSRREIAEMDGVTEAAIKSRLARARDAFAAAYERLTAEPRDG